MSIAETGVVLLWGRNVYGQLGLNHTNNRSTPEVVQFPADKQITSISCGYDSTAALAKSGEMFTWGLNTHGELGLGDTSQRNLPQLVLQLQNRHVTQISCGASHTAVLIGRLSPCCN